MQRVRRVVNICDTEMRSLLNSRSSVCVRNITEFQKLTYRADVSKN